MIVRIIHYHSSTRLYTTIVVQRLPLSLAPTFPTPAAPASGLRSFISGSGSVFHLRLIGFTLADSRLLRRFCFSGSCLVSRRFQRLASVWFCRSLLPVQAPNFSRSCLSSDAQRFSSEVIRLRSYLSCCPGFPSGSVLVTISEVLTPDRFHIHHHFRTSK